MGSSEAEKSVFSERAEGGFLAGDEEKEEEEEEGREVLDWTCRLRQRSPKEHEPRAKNWQIGI